MHGTYLPLIHYDRSYSDHYEYGYDQYYSCSHYACGYDLAVTTNNNPKPPEFNALDLDTFIPGSNNTPFEPP